MKRERIRESSPASSIGDYITSSLVRIDGHDEIHVLSPQPNSDSGQKSWVNLNENEFLYAGGDPASVYTINQSDFSCYTEAGSIRSVDDFRAFNALGVLPKKIGISSLMIFPVTNAEGVDVIKKGVSSPFLNFNLYAEGEDVRIKSIVFTVWATGTAVCTNVKDILVYGPDGSLVNTTPVSVGSDCRAKVKFNAYRITDKNTATFTVKARVDSPQEYLKLGIDTTLDIDTDAIMMSMLDAERNLGFDSEGRLGWETTPVVGNLKKVIP